MTAPQQVEDVAQAIKESPDRLGLALTIAACTVEGNSDPLAMSVRADGDSIAIPAVPVTAYAAVGARAYLMTSPDGAQWLLSRGMHRIDYEELTTGTGGFTAETIVHTVSFPGVAGRRYRIYVDTHMGSTVSTDTGNLRIRYDDLSGAELNSRFNVPITVTSSGGNYMTLSGEFDATETQTYTFVATMQRGSGTGNVSLVAGATRPSVFAADYVSG